MVRRQPKLHWRRQKNVVRNTKRLPTRRTTNWRHITWNGSWSYTFNTYKARENLEWNENLVEEMVNEFCVDMWKHRHDYEYLDVSIRCYILGECIDRVLTECTRTCEECWKVFIEGYNIRDTCYYCSDECLKESLTEWETIEDLRLWEDDSPNYRTSRIECL